MVTVARVIKASSSLILIATIYSLTPTEFAYSHPGRTDSSGGHTCRTNCDSWGLEYGEYHTHGTPSSRTSSISDNDESSGISGWWWVGGLGAGYMGYLLYENHGKNKSRGRKNINPVAMSSEGYLKCKNCGANLLKRNGRYGQFYGCSKYPRCKYTRNIKK